MILQSVYIGRMKYAPTMVGVIKYHLTDVTQSPFSNLKNTHNEVAIATIIFNRVIAPEGEILSFAPPKESIQRKGGSITASSCAPRFCRGSVERASCPPTDARHPCLAPTG